MRFSVILLFLSLLTLSTSLLASGRTPAPESLFQGKPGEPVTVKEFAKVYGFDSVVSKPDHLLLKGKVHTLVLYRGSRRAVLNGTLVWLNQPLTQEQGVWVLRVKDVQLTLHPLLRPSDALVQEGYEVVVLDPGHGGQDSGAQAPFGLLEKDVTLDIARRVRSLLQQQGVKVYLTRHDDRFLELDERPRRANRWDADLFVSLHANSGGVQAQGLETFVLSIPGSLSTNSDPDSAPPTASHHGNQHDAANMALSYAVHHALRTLPGSVDRGVKRARFAVLRNADCPATLVEMGFLTHPVEGKRFQDAKHRDAVARSIARGIDNYLRAVKTATMTAETTSREKTP